MASIYESFSIQRVWTKGPLTLSFNHCEASKYRCNIFTNPEYLRKYPTQRLVLCIDDGQDVTEINWKIQWIYDHSFDNRSMTKMLIALLAYWVQIQMNLSALSTICNTFYSSSFWLFTFNFGYKISSDTQYCNMYSEIHSRINDNTWIQYPECI